MGEQKTAGKKRETVPTASPAQHPDLLSAEVLRTASELAARIEAAAILVQGDCLAGPEVIQAVSDRVQVVVIEREGKECPLLHAAASHVLRIPAINLTRMGQIKLSLLASMSRGIFSRGETIVCLSGSALTGMLDTLMVIQIGEEHEVFMGFEAQNITRNVKPEVFDKVLEIVLELAYQGREGKSVGAIFVIGDEKEVAKYTDQLIINPFRGYHEDERNILDPRLSEAVKTLATIDGAFIVRGDGTILSAGTYLRPALAGEALPQGLGARHAAACSVSASTDAIVITVSESTGTVRMFKDGRIITEIEKPVRAG